MAFKASGSDTQKVTLTLPKAVLARLNELVPARQRSRFVAEALEERLSLEEQVLALEETAGAWSDENHPEMQDDQAIDRWLEELRSSAFNSADFKHVPGLSLYALNEDLS